ncbi:MAG: tryptophan-rich sensory protein [Verrucomicrobia bacterium]|nr:tryptophan-rich sensory protein [Verrucomicrobiota bacterium]
MKAKRQRVLALFLFFLLVFSVAYLGSLFTQTSVQSWYLALQKASWNPPAWVFAPVWIVLYGIIAYAGWLVYIKDYSYQRTRALRVFVLQLLMNLLWSFLFFYLRSPIAAFFDILVLVIFIIWMIYSFWPISRKAALLLIPYLLWVIYAATLNAAICFMNKI